jgi:hypothetical protein
MPWTDYDDAENAPFLMNANGCPIMTGSDIRIAYEADGRLIAAAPELMEALKLCVEFIGVASIMEAPWDWEPIKEARAAIAKAEGRGE